jgi:hypothetical protein
LDVDVGEAAIVQVNCQLRRGKRASEQKGSDRFENDLMLGFYEIAPSEGLYESLPFFAGGRFVAQRTQGPKVGGKLVFAIHPNARGGRSLPETISVLHGLTHQAFKD